MTKILILCLALILVTQAVAKKNLLEISSQIKPNGGQLYQNKESSSVKDTRARNKAKLLRVLIDIIKYEEYLANIRYNIRSFNLVRG